MTVSASRSQNRASYRNRPVPIPAAFVPSHHNVHFCVRGAQVISSMRPATDHFGNGIACITNVTDASCPPAPIQIPIALRINPATAQRPAVSSPEACPTPAIQVMRVPIRPRPTAGIRQPLTRAVILRTVSNDCFRRAKQTSRRRCPWRPSTLSGTCENADMPCQRTRQLIGSKDRPPSVADFVTTTTGSVSINRLTSGFETQPRLVRKIAAAPSSADQGSSWRRGEPLNQSMEL
jgi:hypothetical protein